MKIGAPRETAEGEARVAMTPQSARDLQKLGHECLIERDAGAKAGFDDAAYEAAGVTVVDNVWEAAEVIAKVQPPTEDEAGALKDSQTLISFFWPAANEALLEKAKSSGASVIAMDMVPRSSKPVTTLAASLPGR